MMRRFLCMLGSAFLLGGCGEAPPWSWNGGDMSAFYQALDLNAASFETLNTYAAQANIQQWLPAMMPFLSGIVLSEAQQIAIHQQVSSLANPTASDIAEARATAEQFQVQIRQLFLSDSEIDATLVSPFVEAVNQQTLAEVTAMLAVWDLLTPDQQSMAYAHAKYQATQHVMPVRPVKDLLDLSVERQEQLALSASQLTQLFSETQRAASPLSPALNTLALVDFLSSQQATPEKLLAFHRVFVQNQKVVSDLMILHEILSTEQRKVLWEELEFIPLPSQTLLREPVLIQ